MAVYDGVPSIRLEGDEKRALALIPEAKALLYKVQTFLSKSQVGTFSMSRRVDADSYIYALCANGQNILRISVKPKIPDEITTVSEEDDSRQFPDFYSGLVYDGRFGERTRVIDGETVRFSVLESFSPTPTCQRVHDLNAGRQAVGRLAVAPHNTLPELMNEGAGAAYTQYQRLRSSMYSGKMKQVVQVAMGLGRIGKPKMRHPNIVEPDSEYIKYVGRNGVRIPYDYKFNRTHGITTAADGRLWLVEISITRGVLATPLPIFPTSDTENFKLRAEDRDDAAMVRAVEDLGCLPTGEGFPADLDGAIADGTVLRLLSAADLEPFYDCSAYSSALGWAFNRRGTEAHNTAYYFSDSDGIQRGVWYQINLQIGATNEDWRPGTPLASASANIRLQAEGHIYCPPLRKTSRGRYVPIKFYEPLLPGLLSHDGAPEYGSPTAAGPRCDTVMFVAFNDDELKVVKFFRNPRRELFNDTDDSRIPGECMYAGSWDITVSSGYRSIPPMMYSNDFDDRRVLQDLTVHTHIESHDLGYDPPRFADFIINPQVSRAWRERVFRRTTEIERKDGDSVGSVVAIPQYSREAYYYALGEQYTGGRSGSTSVNYDLLPDPNVGYAWRAWPSGFAGFPWPEGIGCRPDRCGGIWTPDGSRPHKDRKIVCLNLEEYQCSEYAEAGPWLTVCQSIDHFNSVVPMDKTPTYSTWDRGADQRAALKLVTPGHGGPVSIPLTYSEFDNSWSVPSPDPKTMIIQHIYAEHSAIGDDLVVYYDNLSVASPNIVKVGFSHDSIDNDTWFPGIVGVNIP